MATKTIGGTDGMHIKPDRHPFEITAKASAFRQPLAKSQAAHGTAAGVSGKFLTDPNVKGK